GIPIAPVRLGAGKALCPHSVKGDDMRVHHWALAAAMATTVSVAAFAQEPGAPGITTNTTQTTTNSTDEDRLGPGKGEGFASAFVGSNFGAMNNSTNLENLNQGSSLDFGGSFGYLWNKKVGAEFLAGFTPNFHLKNTILRGEQPQVNSYMFNAMGAIPIGSAG